MQQLINVQTEEELTLDPLKFTIADIIDIAKLLNKDPSEIFETILNDLNDSGLIKQCEERADEMMNEVQY